MQKIVSWMNSLKFQLEFFQMNLLVLLTSWLTEGTELEK